MFLLLTFSGNIFDERGESNSEQDNLMLLLISYEILSKDAAFMIFSQSLKYTITVFQIKETKFK